MSFEYLLEDLKDTLNDIDVNSKDLDTDPEEDMDI